MRPWSNGLNIARSTLISVNNWQLRALQRLALGLGIFVVVFGLLGLIGLRRSPDGFQPAPYVGLVIVGTAMLIVVDRWKRRTTVKA